MTKKTWEEEFDKKFGWILRNNVQIINKDSGIVIDKDVLLSNFEYFTSKTIKDIIDECLEDLPKETSYRMPGHFGGVPLNMTDGEADVHDSLLSKVKEILNNIKKELKKL